MVLFITLKVILLNRKLNILVTGATGFIGGYVVRDLLSQNKYNIYAMQRSPEYYGLLQSYQDQIHWVTGNIMDVPFLDSIMAQIDVIVHTAALVSFHRKDRKKLYEINQVGTANLINTALEHDVQHFIQVSSIAAIGRPPGINEIHESLDWIESDHNTDYAISKRLADLEVFRGMAEGLPISILNPTLVIGTGFWERSTSLFFNAIRKGLKFHPIGSAGVVDVRDVSKSILRTLEQGPSNDRLIINGTNISYKEFFNKIATAFEVTPPKIPVTRSLVRWAAPFMGFLEIILGRKWHYGSAVIRNTTHQYVYNNQKSKDVLDLKYRPLEESIREIVDKWKAFWPEQKGIMLES